MLSTSLSDFLSSLNLPKDEPHESVETLQKRMRDKYAATQFDTDINSEKTTVEELYNELTKNGTAANYCINKRGRCSMTLLQTFVEYGNLEIVRVLLKAGAHPNQLRGFDHEKNINAVPGMRELLRDYGFTDVKPCEPDTKSKALAAVKAGNTKALQEILETYDLNLDSVNESMSTSSCRLAARNGDLEMLQLMVRYGADFDEIDGFEGTIAEEARKNGKTEVADYLENAMKDQYTRLKNLMDARKTHECKSQIKIFLSDNGEACLEVAAVPIESVIMEGAGARGHGYIGAIKALFDNGIMQNVKRVGGASAGSVAAGPVALGYGAEKALHISREVPINDLWEMAKLSTFGKIRKLLKKGYLNEGEILLQRSRTVVKRRVEELMVTYKIQHQNDPEKLQQLAALQINSDRVTFKNLHDLSVIMPESGIKDYFLVAAKVPTKQHQPYVLRVFSHSHSPGVEVSLAGIAAAAAPLLVRPVVIDGETYIDGGVLCSFPIQIFNEECYKPKDMFSYQGQHNQNLSTLGVRVDTDEEIKRLLYAPPGKRALFTRFAHYLFDRIMGIPTFQVHRALDRRVKEQYGHRTCQLNDTGTSWMQFDLARDMEDAAIQRGEEDMQSWINNYYGAATDIRRFSSFTELCESFNTEELENLLGEIERFPGIFRRDDGSAVSQTETQSLLDTAKKILEQKFYEPEMLSIVLTKAPQKPAAKKGKHGLHGLFKQGQSDKLLDYSSRINLDYRH